MTKLKIGILDIIALPAQNLGHKVFTSIFAKQLVSFMPQAISVWCRQAGHDVFYATYYGAGDLESALPGDPDIVFISCPTSLSHLAYMLARQYRRTKTLTVIGGPHAVAFPADCIRFFDVVVKECDRQLITDILAGEIPPHSFISSSRPVGEFPYVRERLPEIRRATFLRGQRPFFASLVPMLASVGCPYRCDFCTDWNRPYHLLSLDRLGADLKYINHSLQGAFIAFYDPNFGVTFDDVMSTIEAVPAKKRVPYGIQCSLSVINEAKLKRLKATNCIMVAPGVESWTDYAAKSVPGRPTGEKKVSQVVDHLQLVNEYIPYIQVNFLMGLDSDQGASPFSLTKQFIRQAPFAWPTINIPAPFGGTPWFEELYAGKRILETLPFAFYYTPYLAIVLKHYEPIRFYQYLCGLYEFQISKEIVSGQNRHTADWRMKAINQMRRFEVRRVIACYQRIIERLRSDRQLRAFHDGVSQVLPDFYLEEYHRYFGSYTDRLTPEERVPNLEQILPAMV